MRVATPQYLLQKESKYEAVDISYDTTGTFGPGPCHCRFFLLCCFGFFFFLVVFDSRREAFPGRTGVTPLTKIVWSIGSPASQKGRVCNSIPCVPYIRG